MTMVKIAGLVQARMGSQRLPGKVMRPLCGKPLIGHIFDRLRSVNGVSAIVLATTADPRNDLLASYARSQDVLVYREVGEDDIAARLAGAAREAGADAVLKVNGDCPMVDPSILQRLVQCYLSHAEVDYVSNKIVWTWPEGMSAEVIRASALQWCNMHLSAAEDRELVANWIRDHTERFARLSVEAEADERLDLPSLAVDTPADFAEVERVFSALYSPDRLFDFSDIVNYYRAKKSGEIRDRH